MQKFIILAPDGVDFQLQRVPGINNIMLIKTTDADCMTIELPVSKLASVTTETKSEDLDTELDG